MKEDYSTGVIYIIRNRNDDTKIGIGSTNGDIYERFYRYKPDTKTAIGKCMKVDPDNWYIEKYEDYPCNSRKELDKREGIIIKQIATINKNIAGRNRKEYYQDKKDHLIKYQLNYYLNNKEKRLQYQLNYYRNKKNNKNTNLIIEE